MFESHGVSLDKKGDVMMECENMIIKDQDGNILISIDQMDEAALSREPLFTHCLAVIKVGNEYLMGKNKWRNRYEVFGGCAEKGETARECILRECREELGLSISDIVYLGAMKLLLKPDYFSKDERVELGGLYGITLPGMSIDDIYGMVNDREEIAALDWYSNIKDKETIALIDEKLLDYYI